MKVTITIDSPTLTEQDIDTIEQIIDNRFNFAFEIGIVVDRDAPEVANA